MARQGAHFRRTWTRHGARAHLRAPWAHLRAPSPTSRVWGCAKPGGSGLAEHPNREAPRAHLCAGALRSRVSPKVHCTSPHCTAWDISTAQRECAPHIATAHHWCTTHCVAERGTPLMCDRDVRCPLPLCGARRLAVPSCDVQWARHGAQMCILGSRPVTLYA